MPRTAALHAPTESHATDLARALAAALRPGDVLLLDGPLGAGKTTLARAIAAALGADPRDVASPTFVLLHAYPREDLPPVVHVDAYRLAPESDPAELGLDALDERAIVLVEWPQRLASWVRGLDPERVATLRITPTGLESRRLELAVPESWADRPALSPLTGDRTCPVTGRPVRPDSTTFPFADERARMADLYRWFAEEFRDSRPAEPEDFDEEASGGRGRR